MNTDDKSIEHWEEMLKREKAQRHRTAIICKNCAWYGTGNMPEGIGRCLRFPPKESTVEANPAVVSQFRLAICESMPVVHEEWLCGEFLNARTGYTPYSDDKQSQGMRARIAELEDRIEELRRRATQ